MLLRRESELAALSESLRASADTGGRVFLLRGEAGVGKTTLVSQFLRSMGATIRPLVGYCDNLRTPQPFGPLWDLRDRDATLRDALTKADHRAVVDAILDLLAPGSEEPTVVVIEDTQWADEATLDALTAVGRRIALTTGLLVLSYRDAEVDYDHPIRSVFDAIQPDRIDRMTLQPLTTAEVQQMIGNRITDIGRLMELSNGNPLLVEEIAAVGLERLPASIEDRVAARMATLSSAARRLLEVVSVAPGGLQSSHLARFGLEDPDLVTEAQATGWIEVQGNSIAYRHDVIRQTVEAMLSGAMRLKINQHIAESLIDEDAAPALIAHHAEEAEMPQVLLDYGRQAGEAAMAAGSYREALAHYRSLQPYIDDIDDAQRAGILSRWAICAFHNDDPTAVDLQEQLIEIHRASGDLPQLIRSLAAAVRLYQSNGLPEAARRVADEAVAISGSGSAMAERAYALSQSGWLSLLHGEGQQAIRRAQEAIELADAHHDASVLTSAMTTKGSALLPADEGVELLHRAGDYAAAHGLWFEHGRTLVNLAQQGLADPSKLDESVSLARRAVQVGERFELESLRTFATSQLATMLFHRGDWDEASDLSHSVLGSNRQTDATALTRLGSIYARSANKQAESTLERAWAVSEELDEIGHVSAACAAWAEFCWITGREQDPRLSRCVEVMMYALEGELVTSANRIAVWLSQLGSPRISVDRLELTHELAQRAFDTWIRGNAPYDRAVARLVRRSGEELASLEVLETLGATAVAAKYRQQLRAAGFSVPRGRSRETRSHPAGLTARQAEVLELLSTGLTNAQIADTLFLSLRTVEKHVSAVLGKLNVATRAEAVAEATARSLLEGTATQI